MQLDPVLLHTLVTLATGTVVALEHWRWRPRRQVGADRPVGVRINAVAFPILLSLLILRTFVVEPFRIPSGSMVPTLLVGDFIMVDKAAYGLRIASLRWTLLDGGRPQRGEVVVFRYPEDPSATFVKRVVGLPGDRISYRDGQLRVNDEPVPREPLGPYSGGPAGAELYSERLGRVAHRLVRIPGRPALEDDFVVPQGHYYVLGDNRDASNDSRSWGTVPESHLVGRPMFVWLSWEPGRGPDWQRVGEDIR